MMCPHNNMGDYCPSCILQKSQRRNGMRGMGADCQPGYYEGEVLGIKTGVCLPDSATLAQQAAGGLVGAVTTGASQSPGVIVAAQTSAGNALGNKILAFYREKPAVAIGLTLGVVALVVYGGMSFARGK